MPPVTANSGPGSGPFRFGELAALFFLSTQVLRLTATPHKTNPLVRARRFRLVSQLDPHLPDAAHRGYAQTAGLVYGPGSAA